MVYSHDDINFIFLFLIMTRYEFCEPSPRCMHSYLLRAFFLKQISISALSLTSPTGKGAGKSALDRSVNSQVDNALGYIGPLKDPEDVTSKSGWRR